jgi:hypothetical protein
MATLLDGVNTLLMARGMAPVNEIISGHPAHASAVRMLERHKSSVQANRWWFNTETGYQLSIDEATSKVPVPSTVQDLDDCIYQIMNGYLYDPIEGTNIFTTAPDTVTLIFNRDWEELPITAFILIESMAKEEFIRHMNDQLKTVQAEKDINKAFANLQAQDLRHKDVSINNMPLMAKWKARMPTR